MEFLIQVIGWIGTFLVVFAFHLVSTKRVSGNDMKYQLLNLSGALFVGTYVFHQEAWSAVALQVIWGCISIVTLVKIFAKK